MESETSILDTPALQPARPGLSWRGLIEVFYKPAQFFEEIKTHPRVLVAWVLSVLLVMASLYFLMDFIVDMQIKAAIESQRFDPSTMSMEQMKGIMRASIFGFGSFVWALYPLLAAALAMLVGNFFMGGNASYKQLLSVVCYGSIVYLVGGLLMVPLAVAKGSMAVTLSLAAFLPNPDISDPLWVLLSKFGVFNVWEIIVVGIGLSVVYNKSRNKGYLMAVLSVGVLSLLQAASTAVSKMMN